MNQTTLTQVIYRAMTDTTYALNVFLKIPVTPDNYGDYETIAKSIRSHYRKYDEPFSKEALTADVIDSLKRTNKDAKETIDTQIETITTIARLAKQHNYSNDKDIEFKTDEWSRTRLATNAIMRNLGSGKAVGDPKVIEKLIKDLNEATNIGNISELGESVSLFDADDTDKMVDLLSHVQQNTIPLNLPSLDHLMGGGLAKGEMGMVLSPSGRGKAQPLDTLIPTPNGVVKLGSLNIGDYVYNRFGKPVQVKAIYPQGKKELYKVTTDDGRVTFANDEHLFSYFARSYNGKTKTYKHYLSTKTLKEMLELGVKSDTQGYRYKIPIAPAIELPEEPHDISPYTIGAFIGDGSLTSKYVYMSASDEKLPILDRIVCESGFYGYKRNSDKNYSYYFYGADGHVVKPEYLPSELLHKAYDKSIPESYKYGSVSQREALMQGLLDTDGSVHARKGTNSVKVDFSTTSKQLANDVIEVLRSLGFKAQLSVHDRTSNPAHKHKDYVINVAGTIEHLKHLFSTPERLNNFSGLKEKSNGQDRVSIVAIEDMHKEVEMECIYVDDPEHLYVTSDYIVTHNTTTLINMAKRYAVDSKQNVLYLALEERVNRLVLRAFRAVTNQKMGDIYDSLGNPDTDKLKKQLTAFQKIKEKGAIGDLDIFASKPQIVSPTSVERILQQYMLKHGHYPDILIIDYPDLMENPYLAQGVNEFRAAGMLYEAIRRIAGQYQMVVWVASQMNRMSSQQEIMNAYAIEGSKQKLNTVELCMSLNQTDAEFKAGFMRFYIDKVRNPGEGTWDKIIKFKVNVNSMTYNEETPEESAAHDEVLSTKEQGPFDEYKKPKMSAEQARKKTAEANAIIASQNL